ncbi:hypothetical protein AGABI1DRAFT_131813 [Agaricus bisporus var. burnettii JB137-S8]|uniref:Uncharacterized protein n=1 Tax=Agaricus bisporus var. burnettii (strain JB137-S8 / ATCC MYA-4627 / FGSC 10392) TaxID=597362 RepID=K5XMS7_AGABU|nr:uncharacterized protein AGABI1DRAFT_131813 [Agaricus bisporus var. burnettii JB137-S8]EKM75915.1 hypothetical protein AGABI1DRAFT_131813 [Agaricus bisporus var. burnettii JB137-S8]
MPITSFRWLSASLRCHYAAGVIYAGVHAIFTWPAWLLEARQWVEVRDWWSYSEMLTNAYAVSLSPLSLTLADVHSTIVAQIHPGWQSPPPSERRSHLFLSASTNPSGRVAILTTTQTTEGDFLLGASDGSSEEVAVAGLAGMTRRYASSRHYTRSSIKNNKTSMLGAGAGCWAAAESSFEWVFVFVFGDSDMSFDSSMERARCQLRIDSPTSKRSSTGQ